MFSIKLIFLCSNITFYQTHFTPRQHYSKRTNEVKGVICKI